LPLPIISSALGRLTLVGKGLLADDLFENKTAFNSLPFGFESFETAFNFGSVTLGDGTGRRERSEISKIKPLSLSEFQLLSLIFGPANILSHLNPSTLTIAELRQSRFTLLWSFLRWLLLNVKPGFKLCNPASIRLAIGCQLTVRCPKLAILPVTATAAGCSWFVFRNFVSACIVLGLVRIIFTGRIVAALIVIGAIFTPVIIRWVISRGCTASTPFT
jgi:hypothetical protein